MGVRTSSRVASKGHAQGKRQRGKLCFQQTSDQQSCHHPACPSCPRYLSWLPCSALPRLHPACPSCSRYLSCLPCSALPGLHPAFPVCPGCTPAGAPPARLPSPCVPCLPFQGSTSEAAAIACFHPACPACPGYLSCLPCLPFRGCTSEAAAIARLHNQRGNRRRVHPLSARQPPSRASTVSEAAAVAYLCHKRGCRRRVPLSSARLPPSLVPQSPGGMHEATNVFKAYACLKHSSFHQPDKSLHKLRTAMHHHPYNQERAINMSIHQFL